MKTRVRRLRPPTIVLCSSHGLARLFPAPNLEQILRENEARTVQQQADRCIAICKSLEASVDSVRFRHPREQEHHAIDALDCAVVLSVLLASIVQRLRRGDDIASDDSGWVICPQCRMHLRRWFGMDTPETLAVCQRCGHRFTLGEAAGLRGGHER